MKLSKRVSGVTESLTLKLNAKANQMANDGRKVHNLTAGQLPFRPLTEFTDAIRSESDFLKSYQYSPVPGYPELRKKLLDYFKTSRNISLDHVEYDCIISNGGKHSLSNIFASLIDKDDEVIIISPYWVSYPELIRLYDGVPVFVETTIYDAFVPLIESIEKAITKKTKAIIINSPNNPTGTHYSDAWMKDFAAMIKKHEDVIVISDEIYYELGYYDPTPTYFYQHDPELLKRTVIVDGISKNLACTGLRIGYTFATKELIGAMANLQGQTTSGANSLIQKALMTFDFDHIDSFLAPIKQHLRENSAIVRDALKEANLAKCWYQTSSAFYFMIDFSQTPVMKKFRTSENDTADYSGQICEDILEKHGVAMVPGIAFGMANTARISLVSQKESFKEAIQIIVDYLCR
ncbi:aminotransferase, class I/II [Bacteriovorax sp. BSW11_IV]|uniref:pyridoxal phosphate-dependent aminotransferase n=1 Tax=Bacteriovorax sp. BSW11_IV TaxID=1353529 RepID=UPI00038A0760|nr:aminotransferase class I/II-fold pyridoxal phosphate-dependent enzyme [Bacteriovorax sp. BSW11_IV]EQC48155.1 aminotransferase, class I/II [Bacteriovorax sp. BSW11_IV]